MRMISALSFDTMRPVCGVPQNRHRHAGRHTRVGALVDLPHEGRSEQRVARRAVEIGVEGPALAQHVGMHDRNADMILQPLELRKIIVRFAQGQAWLTNRGGSARFRLRTRHRRWVPARHPASPSCGTARLPLERAAGGFGVVPLVAPDAVDQETHEIILTFGVTRDLGHDVRP
jgi:hypothetical protein